MTAAKIAVTVPDELVDEARQAVRDGAAPSPSAYVTSAMDAYRHRHTLDELLRDLDEEFGEVDAENRNWAANELDRAEGELMRRRGGRARERRTMSASRSTLVL